MSGFQRVCLALTQQLSIIQVMCFVVWRSTNQEIVSQHGHLAGDYKTGYLCWVNLRSWSLVLLQHSSYFCQSVTISTCTQRVTWLLECKTQENIKSCPVSCFFPKVPPSLSHPACPTQPSSLPLLRQQAGCSFIPRPLSVWASPTLSQPAHTGRVWDQTKQGGRVWGQD